MQRGDERALRCRRDVAEALCAAGAAAEVGAHGGQHHVGKQLGSSRCAVTPSAARRHVRRGSLPASSDSARASRSALRGAACPVLVASRRRLCSPLT